MANGTRALYRELLASVTCLGFDTIEVLWLQPMMGYVRPGFTAAETLDINIFIKYISWSGGPTLGRQNEKYSLQLSKPRVYYAHFAASIGIRCSRRRRR